ncbi:MAG: AraC family transcriptional regulator [Marinifilaceae bacterium]|nr:AraC family transcriptional regulator [Marinifilaceae bacterium]
MIYKEFPILPELIPYVQVVWMMESEKEDECCPKEQIMPDGILEFVTHYRDPWLTTIAGEAPALQAQSFVVSQMRKSIEIESNGKTGFISVRFFPWGGYHFFNEPVSNFLDASISSKELWPQHYHSVMQQIDTAQSPEERVELIQQFLLARLTEYRKENKVLDEAVKLIRESKGQLSIAEVAQRIGFSKKQLERTFAPAIGTTPKTFARISRFLNICHHLEEYKNKSLTQLSYECGYFDQAHFIKEFREFSGYTPKEFFARNNVAFANL